MSEAARIKFRILFWGLVFGAILMLALVEANGGL